MIGKTRAGERETAEDAARQGRRRREHEATHSEGASDRPGPGLAAVGARVRRIR